MSQLNIKPVLSCKRCGRHVILAQMNTFIPDSDGKALDEMAAGVAKNVYCERCRHEMDYENKYSKGRILRING
jgi:hypothetical protein